MSNLFRGPSIDASYQVLVQLPTIMPTGDNSQKGVKTANYACSKKDREYF
jgi:hypothetical protein